MQACPGKCEENKACVQCAAFDSGPLTEEQCNRDCRKDLIRVESELPGSQCTHLAPTPTPFSLCLCLCPPVCVSHCPILCPSLSLPVCLCLSVYLVPSHTLPSLSVSVCLCSSLSFALSWTLQHYLLII